MKLSELKTGEKGVIVKVLGHGGFRKRIVEMGFIKGKMVEVLLNAPLRDPVKYRIMGYEVSLRHEEADMIEILSADEAKKLGQQTPPEDCRQSEVEEVPLSDMQMRDVAMRRRRVINVALVGNPNCGKTSLFNFASGAHGHVGNYSGVTVDASEAHAEFEGYEFNLVDLPGTYSLSAYSPEELYVRKQIIEQTPDVVIVMTNAYQSMRMVQGYEYGTGKKPAIDMGAMQGMCSELTISPYLTGEMNVSVLCPSTRMLCKWSENDMAVGIPYELFEQIVEGVEATQPNY